MTDSRPKIIVIAGPTASGKSSIAVDIAEEFDGEIINADSMQVYRYMDIGTAKPAMDERKGILHHLLDVVDPDEEFNASIYRSMADTIINRITSRGKLSLVVGGTGLYIKTLLGGLLSCPPHDPAIRSKLNSEWDELGSACLHERLKKLDPESSERIHPNDRTRVIRALEVIALTEKPLSSLVQNHGFQESPFQALKICLSRERSELYQRINDRSVKMIESGLVSEVEKLLEKGYTGDLKSMKSLGYRHVLRFIKGDWDKDETVLRLQADTRRYAKRQMTWFKADPEMIMTEPGNIGSIKNIISEFIVHPVS